MDNEEKIKKLQQIQEKGAVALFEMIENVESKVYDLSIKVDNIEIPNEKDIFSSLNEEKISKIVKITPIKNVDYKDGDDGYSPIKNIDYFDGKDGKNGKDGLNGKDGTDGKNGIDAKDGIDGKNGINGSTTTYTFVGDGSMVYPDAGIPISTGTAWGTSIADNHSNWDTAYTNRITSLTTMGSNGSATLSSNTLNIPTYTLAGLGGITLSSLSASAPLSYNNGTGAFTISKADTSTDGYLSSTDWNTFNGKGSGTVTSVTSANSNATVATTTTTPVITIVSAPKWSTARNLAGNSVDGSTDVAFSNKFIVQGTTDAGLSGAQFLGALGTGILKNTTTTGVLSIATGADLPSMTATVGGAVPTPPNNTTTFLRGDGTFATVTATAPDMNINKLTATANTTISDGYNAIVSRKYLINLGIKLILGSGSIFRIL